MKNLTAIFFFLTQYNFIFLFCFFLSLNDAVVLVFSHPMGHIGLQVAHKLMILALTRIQTIIFFSLVFFKNRSPSALSLNTYHIYAQNQHIDVFVLLLLLH